MKNCLPLSRCLAIMLIAIGPGTAAAQQFDSLVVGIPESANVLVIANAKAILDSSLARAEKWRESHKQLYAYGQTSIPPNTELMLMASELDFEFVEPRWQVAMLQVSNQPSLNQIAAEHRGRLETVAGRAAVALPDDAYLVHFGGRIFGSMSPASRQSVSRWISRTEGGAGPSLSPYLTEAYRYVADQGTHAVLAIDLQDAVSVADVRQKIDESDSDYLKVPGLDKQGLSEALASIRGVMLGVNFADQQNGTIIVDFGKDISVLQPLAKPMLLKVLKDYGAFIDEFEGWEARVNPREKRVYLSGKLETSGRRRIMSLITIPAAPSNAEHIAAEVRSSREGDPRAYASQQYCQTIISYLDELRTSGKDAVTLGQVALWLEKYARKIDRLPRRDVDEQCRKYGHEVSTLLRDTAMAYKGIGIQGRVAELEAGSQAGPDYAYGTYRYGRYGRYGYGYAYGWDGTAEQRARLLAVGQVRARGAQSAQDIMQHISNLEAGIRDHIADTYNLDL